MQRFSPFLAVGRLTQTSAEVRECGGVVAGRRTAVAAVEAVADLVTTAKAALPFRELQENQNRLSRKRGVVDRMGQPAVSSTADHDREHVGCAKVV